MIRCEACPVADCIALKTRHKTYCSWATKGGAYRQRVIDLSENPQITPAYPSVIEQAGNAVSAMGRVFKAVVTQQAVAVSDEEQQRRLAICETCEFYDAIKGRCTKCGCLGTFKAWIATERCPIDKW